MLRSAALQRWRPWPGTLGWLRSFRRSARKPKKPQPMILVDELGSSAINLRVYYWFDFAKHSRVKLRSALMRRVLAAFDEAGISAPDAAREIVFPEGVPLVRPRAGGASKSTEHESSASSSTGAAPPSIRRDRDDVPCNSAEDGLESDIGDLQAQDARSRPHGDDDGDDLLQAGKRADKTQRRSAVAS